MAIASLAQVRRVAWYVHVNVDYAWLDHEQLDAVHVRPQNVAGVVGTQAASVVQTAGVVDAEVLIVELIAILSANLE